MANPSKEQEEGMSTINGCGTLHYDWSHSDDGTSCATKWFVLFFFPIIPLKREHLRVENAGALGATHFPCGQVPMQAYGVIRTYLKAYLLVPVVFLGPPAALVACMLAVIEFLPVDPRGVAIPAVLGITCLIYWGVVLTLILERSFGKRKTKDRMF